MTQTMHVEDYLKTVKDRLETAGFGWEDGGEGQLGVAHRSEFQLSKFGNCEEFFVFRKIDATTAGAVASFSEAAFAYAKGHKSCALPCGLFNSVYVFAVGLADSVPPEVAAAIKSKTPAKHWAAAEVPVLLDLERGELSYFEKTPVWGAAYYRGFREKIQKFLLP